jgi:hypothetical protein
MKEVDYKIYSSFGYIPRPVDFNYKEFDKNYKNHIDFTNSIFDKFNYSGKHLVPLSGGLDSRYILIKILQRVSAEDIQCVTFGDSRSYDVRFASFICKKLGIKWNFIDSNILNRTDKRNIELSVKNGRHLFYSFPYFTSTNFDNIWNGVLGDYLYELSSPSIDRNMNSDFIALYKKKSVFNLDDDVLEYLDTYRKYFNEVNCNIQDAFIYGDRLPNYYIPNTRISFKENRPFADLDYLGGLRLNHKNWNVPSNEARLMEIEKEIGVFPYKNRAMNSALVNFLMRMNDFQLRFRSKSAYVNYYQGGDIFLLYRRFIEQKSNLEILDNLSSEQRNFFRNVKNKDLMRPVNQVRLLNIMSIILIGND